MPEKLTYDELQALLDELSGEGCPLEHRVQAGLLRQQHEIASLLRLLVGLLGEDDEAEEKAEENPQ